MNLMNSKTFDSLFDRKVLEFTSLRMEAYGNNNAVEVLGKFHAFLIWKRKVYRQLFYVTNVNNSPSLISRDTCYTLEMIKPCYSVETDSSSSSFPRNSASNTHTIFKALGTSQDLWDHIKCIGLQVTAS